MERKDVQGLDETQPQEMDQEQAGADDQIGQRAQMLMDQAQEIAEMGGPNMLEVFQKDPVIREKIGRGEWDFMIAYGYLLGQESVRGQARRAVPQAVRTPNSANIRRGVASMSDKEFDALNDRLNRGEVVDPGK